MVCQSCGRAFTKGEQGGTEADGSKSTEYCSQCYHDGVFANPHLTVQQMVEQAKTRMREAGVPGLIARLLAARIPRLKRWHKKEVYRVDTSKSVIYWKGKLVVGSSTRAGTVQVLSGEMTLVDNRMVKGVYIVDMTSMESDENDRTLVAALKSDDFLKVRQFPTCVFTITSAVKKGEETDIAFENVLTGTLSLAGVERSVTFPVVMTKQGRQLTTISEFSIDRRNWDIRYQAMNPLKRLGDAMVSDEIEVRVNTVAYKVE